MKSPRRILHIASTLDPYGASRQLRILVKRLREGPCTSQVIALRTAQKLHVVTGSAKFGAESLGQRWDVDPIAAGRLAVRLGRSNADLIHCWDLNAMVYATLLRSSRSRLPMIASLPSLHWEFSRIGRLLRSGLLRGLAKKLDRIVVGSETLYDQSVSAGIDARKLLVIPSGVDMPGEPPCSRDKFLKELNLSSDVRLVVVIGPLVPHKRVNDAIWCFELVRVMHERARLLVVGDGPDRRRLERFARLVCHPGSVRFLGLRTDVADILGHADVLWQRSGWEAGPHAVLEAMAAGVPVVATDIESHRQFIEHQRTGFLVPVGNRAECTRITDRLLASDDLARKIGGAASTFAKEHFSSRHMVEAYQRLYGELSPSPFQ